MEGELRCPHKLFGIVTDSGLLEVSCNSSRCGKTAGVVVKHYFDLVTGQMKDTIIFREPASLLNKKE